MEGSTLGKPRASIKFFNNNQYTIGYPNIQQIHSDKVELLYEIERENKLCQKN